jgi:tetratricopeptide (TPR) repeat protein
LGLISYEKKDYEAADNFYRLALDKGAGEALVFYARGVNAASAGQRPEAIRYLSRAAEINPGQYGERCAAIVRTLSGQQE